MLRRSIAPLVGFFFFSIAMPAAAQELPDDLLRAAAAIFEHDAATALADASLPLGLDGDILVMASLEQPFAAGAPFPVWVAPRPDRRPPLLPAMYVALAGLQTYDAYSTIMALRRGAVEKNPVFRGVLGHPAAVVAVKSAVTLGSIYLSEHLWRKHRRVAAVVLMSMTNGMMALVAARNAAVLRSQR